MSMGVYRSSGFARKHVPLWNNIVLSQQQQAKESIPVMEPLLITDYIQSSTGS